jgi:hypothetical protein
LKLSDDEIEEAFTSAAAICPALFHALHASGVLPGRVRDSRSTKAVKTFIRAHNKALSVVAMGVNVARLLPLVGA